MLHTKPRVEIVPGMPRHMPGHDALLHGPRRRLVVADVVDEFEGFAQVLACPRRLERNELPVVADVIVPRFVAHQLRARFLDQRNQTILQPVHLLRPEFDMKVGKPLEVTHPAARTVGRLENRRFVSRCNKTLGRRQTRGTGPDDDDRSCGHTRIALRSATQRIPEQNRRQPHFPVIALPSPH